MNQKNVEELYENVMCGKIEKKEAVGMLGKYISENYPMFGLHRYDEDFRANLFLAFLEKGEHVFDSYERDRSDFFKFFYYYVLGLVSAERRGMKLRTCREALVFQENVVGYHSKEVRYGVQNAFETKMNCVCESENRSYCPFTKEQLKNFYSNMAPKYSDKKILVLALKASFYLTENHIKKVCKMYEIDERIFHDTILYCKQSVDSKKKRRQKIIEKRNYNYYLHRKCADQIKNVSINVGKTESVIIKDRLLKLEDNHHRHWENINFRFEKGFMYLRPTNKTIGEILGICERQVSYYINCAKQDVKKGNLVIEGLNGTEAEDFFAV